jgi:tetratricopeptide (TPR) repeat protein
MSELRMLENSWASEYLRGLFGREGKSLEDLDDLVLASEILAMEEPSLELIFLRQGNSSAQGFNLAIAMLALCDKEAPVALVAELIEVIEECRRNLMKAREALPEARIVADKEPENGDKLAELGFVLNSLDERRDALSAFTKALEHPDTLRVEYHRDCVNNIGWDHYLRGEYEEALDWFQHACQLNGPGGSSESDGPYQLALENVLLALSKLGRLREAAIRLEEYHKFFGRLPRYESVALEKLGLQPDIIFVRACTRSVASEAEVLET